MDAGGRIIRILVVDDSRFARELAIEIITEQGWEVVATAQNGLEAIACYREHLPDLVVMDINTPELDGLAALKQIKHQFPDAKVLMCTALGTSENLKSALVLGAADFVVKPFLKERLVLAIERILPGKSS
jgi:two-component system chemotaxis response regulator CheY